MKSGYVGYKLKGWTILFSASAITGKMKGVWEVIDERKVEGKERRTIAKDKSE